MGVEDPEGEGVDVGQPLGDEDIELHWLMEANEGEGTSDGPIE